MDCIDYLAARYRMRQIKNQRGIRKITKTMETIKSLMDVPLELTIKTANRVTMFQNTAKIATIKESEFVDKCIYLFHQQYVKEANRSDKIEYLNTSYLGRDQKYNRMLSMLQLQLLLTEPSNESHSNHFKCSWGCHISLQIVVDNWPTWWPIGISFWSKMFSFH